MGSGSFDASASAARTAYRNTTGATAFTRNVDIHAGRTAKVAHDTLDLTKKPHRESRDSDSNPTSVPIGIMVDVTGSMGEIAKLIIDDLHKVMKTITDTGSVPYPSICFGAVGDAYSDRVPIQMGEFEADDELAEQHLSNIYIEGNGGGQDRESYELAMAFFANQVSTDHWEKRGSKGFLFIIGDEGYYPTVLADHQMRYLGLTEAQDISTEEVVEKLIQKWEVFCLRPGQTTCYGQASILKSWQDLLGAERVINVEDWHQIVSMIAGTVSVMSGVSVDVTTAAMRNADLKVTDLVDMTLTRLSTSSTIVSTDHESDTTDSGALRL